MLAGNKQFRVPALSHGALGTDCQQRVPPVALCQQWRARTNLGEATTPKLLPGCGNAVKNLTG